MGSTTQTITPIVQEVQPDIVLKSVSDSVIYNIYSGDKYKSLEELQDSLFHPLIRYLAELFRAELELNVIQCEEQNEL